MAVFQTDNSAKLNGSKSGVERFEHMAMDAGKQIGVAASDAVDTAKSYAKSSRAYVVENPVKGLAMGVAAGVVAGSILTLALRRRS